jgi:hypothetical protein
MAQAKIIEHHRYQGGRYQDFTVLQQDVPCILALAQKLREFFCVRQAVLLPSVGKAASETSIACDLCDLRSPPAPVGERRKTIMTQSLADIS